METGIVPARSHQEKTMNAQTFISGFGDVLRLNAAGAMPQPHHARSSTPLAAPSSAQAGTAEAAHADRAAMLARYRADPVAFRRSAASAARIARGQAIGSVIARVFWGR